MNTSKVMDIDDTNPAEGTAVNIYTEWGEKGENPAQEFEFVPVGDGSFAIKPRLTNGKRCLDVENASANSGVRIWSWSINNSAAQLMEIIKM